jgi:DUF4097 and DUF4098 domain-containing protein YvlB
MMIPSSPAGRAFRLVALAAVVWLVLAPRAGAQASGGSFERTLKVTGPVELTIHSGSGRIHVYPGAGDTVRVAARLRGDHFWFSGDAAAQIRQIEKNPPIEQTGNTIRIGRLAERESERHISISYEVAVPANTNVKAETGSGGVEIGDLNGPVDAHSGSGGITIGRIGGPVVTSTGSGGITVTGAASLSAKSGSGSIRATAVGGPATATSGSGGVRIALTGKGDVDVSSSSGEVIVTGVNGAARVSASSGGIEVEGRPTGPWTVHASSGGITLRVPSDASFDLDARVSSGRIDSTHPITVVGQIDKRRLQGKVRGGGVLVDVHSSSGGIRIQ